MKLTYAVLTGAEVVPVLDALAALRIKVFRDYPYLYDGTREAEQLYLRKFAEAEGAIIVAAICDGKIVGASTGCKLGSEHEEFVVPVKAHGLNVEDIFYCAESVVLREHRGKGAGPRFFALRESHARGLGGRKSIFCAVQRADDHPHAKVEGLTKQFKWQDVGEPCETSKLMQYWIKDL
jgi:GNAT superfamily N-acetyltransferase